MSTANKNNLMFKLDIESYLDNLKEVIDNINIQEINTVIERLIEVYVRGGSIYIFGNGGSASTASHFANDFNKGLCENSDKKFRFYCLNDNIPSLLAIANDLSFNDVFKEQLKNFLTPNDLVIAISGSGNSKNAITAIEYANKNGVETIGLVGYDGGKIKKIVKHYIHVRIHDMQKVEDIHLMLDHLMTSTLKHYFERSANFQMFSKVAVGEGYNNDN